jgi:hypothetical protein
MRHCRIRHASRSPNVTAHRYKRRGCHQRAQVVLARDRALREAGRRLRSDRHARRNRDVVECCQQTLAEPVPNLA